MRVRSTLWAAPVARPLAPESLAGRGLAIADELAGDWGVVRRAGHGKTVGFEVGTGSPA